MLLIFRDFKTYLKGNIVGGVGIIWRDGLYVRTFSILQ